MYTNIYIHMNEFRSQIDRIQQLQALQEFNCGFASPPSTYSFRRPYLVTVFGSISTSKCICYVGEMHVYRERLPWWFLMWSLAVACWDYTRHRHPHMPSEPIVYTWSTTLRLATLLQSCFFFKSSLYFNHYYWQHVHGTHTSETRLSDCTLVLHLFTLFCIRLSSKYHFLFVKQWYCSLTSILTLRALSRWNLT